MATVTIYALCEPDLQVPVIRYIGKTTRLARRFVDHCKYSINARTHLGCWLRSLRVRGEKPILMTLTEIPDEIGSAAEILYIRLAREGGMDLVNSTEGGDGITMTPEVRHKISVSNTGKIPSSESREKNRLAHTNPTPETRRKISEAAKSQIHTPERNLKISKALSNRVCSPETRARLSITAKNRPPISLETRARMSISAKNRRGK